MADISTKIVQEIPLKQRGHDVQNPLLDTPLPENAEKKIEASDQSNPPGSQSGQGSTDQKHTFTVMISKKSGESHATSITAGSADEARAAAQSGLGQGETITSVSESTVPIPDPERGLLA
ncbi:MAG: hypothetical protein H8E36_06820 [Rhodospirillaceae bacterium]|nr:hypothetical protein [Rhodospirillaceae bacterium]